MSNWNGECRVCGAVMEEIERHEAGGNYADYITVWCPDCGTICGSFEERRGPSEHHWRTPNMSPELKTHIIISRDNAKE